MAQRETERFNCTGCGAKYKVVPVESPSSLSDESEIACVICGAPLKARDGGFALKYFLVEHVGKSIHTRRSRSTASAVH
jgi:predicted nucleic acid-binding Zn ribbon protein